MKNKTIPFKWLLLTVVVASVSGALATVHPVFKVISAMAGCTAGAFILIVLIRYIAKEVGKW